MLPDNKKSKLVMLTEKGKKIVEKEIDPIIKAESNVLNRLGDEKRKIFLELYTDYYSLLKEEFEGMDING